MQRTRTGKPKDIVFKKDDLKRLWALIEKEYRADDNDAVNPKLKKGADLPQITIVSAGDLKTEADDPAVFDNDVLDLQKTESVEFSYRNFISAKIIRIRLTEGNSKYSNEFSVSGNNKLWVDSTFAELGTILGAVHPQFTRFRKFSALIVIMLAVAVGASVVELVRLVFSLTGPSWSSYYQAHPLLRVALECLVCAAIGLLPGIALAEWVAALWPSIEFDFGPEHLKQQKQIRGRIGTVIGVLIFPLPLAAFQKFVLGWG